MTIFDDIRKDREAGTPGEWELRSFQSGTVQVIMREWENAKPNPLRDGSMYGYHSAYLSMYNIGWQDEGKIDSEKLHNARRIARVPRLERIALAAEELAEAADWFRASTDAYMKKGGADSAERSILAESAFVKSFAAFRAACGEGE